MTRRRSMSHTFTARRYLVFGVVGHTVGQPARRLIVCWWATAHLVCYDLCARTAVRSRSRVEFLL